MSTPGMATIHIIHWRLDMVNENFASVVLIDGALYVAILPVFSP